MTPTKIKLSVRVTTEQRQKLEELRIAAGKKSLEDYIRCCALSGSSSELLREANRQIGDCGQLLRTYLNRAVIESSVEPEKTDEMIDSFVAVISALRRKIRLMR